MAHRGLRPPATCRWRIRNSCLQLSLTRARVTATLAEAMCPLSFTDELGPMQTEER